MVAACAPPGEPLPDEGDGRTPSPPASPGTDAPGPGALANGGPTFAESLLGGPRVKAQAVVDRSRLVQGEPALLAVELQIAHGFHVNAHPASADWLVPTTVSVEGVEGLRVAGVGYPEAHERRFPFFDGALRVWEGSVVAGLQLEVDADAPVGEHTLRIRVDYQACDDAVCYSPARADAWLPVELAPAGSDARRVASPLLERARFPDSHPRDGTESNR